MEGREMCSWFKILFCQTQCYILAIYNQPLGRLSLGEFMSRLRTKTYKFWRVRWDFYLLANILERKRFIGGVCNTWCGCGWVILKQENLQVLDWTTLGRVCGGRRQKKESRQLAGQHRRLPLVYSCHILASSRPPSVEPALYSARWRRRARSYSLPSTAARWRVMYSSDCTVHRLYRTQTTRLQHRVGKKQQTLSLSLASEAINTASIGGYI